MKKTSQRSLLFRQNVNRTKAEWVHFLDGYRICGVGFVGWDPLDGSDFYCKTVRFSKITQKEAECDA